MRPGHIDVADDVALGSASQVWLSVGLFGGDAQRFSDPQEPSSSFSARLSLLPCCWQRLSRKAAPGKTCKLIARVWRKTCGRPAICSRRQKWRRGEARYWRNVCFAMSTWTFENGMLNCPQERGRRRRQFSSVTRALLPNSLRRWRCWIGHHAHRFLVSAVFRDVDNRHNSTRISISSAASRAQARNLRHARKRKRRPRNPRPDRWQLKRLFHLISRMKLLQIVIAWLRFCLVFAKLFLQWAVKELTLSFTDWVCRLPSSMFWKGFMMAPYIK